MKECIDSCKKLIILLSEVLYTIREFFALLILGIAGCSVSPTYNDRTMIVLISLVVLWLCLVFRQTHKEYLRMMKSDLAHRRFTHIDDFGNPYIRGEDLPEIVDYLYRLEEAENVRPRKRNRGK